MHVILTTLFAAGLICFLGFTWAVKAHFRHTGRMPFGMKVISTLTVIGFGWYVVRLFAGAPSSLWMAGIGCFLLAIAVFTWAVRYTRKTPPTLAYDTDEPCFLFNHGPYQYVRHPFYLSYMLFWTGTAFATPGLLPWIVPMLMLAVYSNAARREEQKFAHSGLANAYRDYRSKVGMFLPNFGFHLTTH